MRVTWAVVLVSALLFSLLMAAWGDLREALMLRVIDDRHVKSFILQLPAEAQAWAGDESLGVAVPHALAEDEPEGSDVATEGMPILLPRVYLPESQLRDAALPWKPGAPAIAQIEALAPGAELLWHDGQADKPGFTPLLLGRDGRLDYALLVTLELPGEGLAFLLRAVHGQSRVYRLSREEVVSDQLSAPGGFWAERRQVTGMPAKIEGQTKTVWRWYFEFEQDEAAWKQDRVPDAWSDAAWKELTR